ncbi:MAG: hypothetical protein ABII12_10365 [Planctomycetota bacterium]
MADLLGYHLGLADEDTRARVEAAFPDKGELAAACAAAKRILSPLDSDTVPEPRVDLVRGVLARIEEKKQTLPFKRPEPAVAPSDLRRSGSGRPLMTMRDLVGLAAAIALFVGVFVPGYHTAQSASRQATCASNLRTTGNGFASYAETFDGQWPYAGPMPAGSSWLRSEDGDVAYWDNSRQVYRLVRGRWVPPSVFICPSRPDDHPLAVQSVDDLDGFPDPRNNSYATNLLTGPAQWQACEEDMPVAADMTPMAEQDRAARRIQARELPANSRSHGTPGGQNVLRANIAVRFYRNPNVGVENDDIYRLIGVQEYTGLERPTLRSDAFLIP